jgi:hypothetical protein
MSNSVKADSWFPRFLPAYTLSGASPAVRHATTAASQTIYRGDPLTMDVTTGDVSLATAVSTEIYGVACANVVTTAADEATDLEMWVANDDTVFVGQADAASATGYPTLRCDIKTSGSGATKKWFVDIGETSTTVVTVIDWVNGDSKSDSTDYGRLYFCFGKSSYLQRTTA